MQQRQHRLRDGERAEEIGVEHTAHRLEARFARRPIGAVGDAGVVDQHVNAAVARGDGGGGGRQRFWLEEIDEDEPSVEALCLEGGGRGFAQRRVARAEQDAGAGPADLLGDLEADAFVVRWVISAMPGVARRPNRAPDVWLARGAAVD